MEKEQQQNTMAVFLALVLGVIVGRNWPKIKTHIQPILKGLEKQYGNFSFASLGALASQKEKIEDIIAGLSANKNHKQKLKGKVKK